MFRARSVCVARNWASFCARSASEVASIATAKSPRWRHPPRRWRRWPRHALGHLHDRQQTVLAAQVARRHRHAKHRDHGLGGSMPGRCAAPPHGDDHAQAALTRLFGVGEHLVGVRCAETTFASKGTPNSFSTSQACCMTPSRSSTPSPRRPGALRVSCRHVRSLQQSADCIGSTLVEPLARWRAASGRRLRRAVLHDAVGDQRVDLLVAVAVLAQHLARVLAEQRRRPRDRGGGAEKRIGQPMLFTGRPAVCTVSTTISRASVCGCESASPIECTGPAGTPAASESREPLSPRARGQHRVHQFHERRQFSLRAVLVAKRGSVRHCGWRAPRRCVPSWPGWRRRC